LNLIAQGYDNEQLSKLERDFLNVLMCSGSMRLCHLRLKRMYKRLYLLNKKYQIDKIGIENLCKYPIVQNITDNIYKLYENDIKNCETLPQYQKKRNLKNLKKQTHQKHNKSTPYWQPGPRTHRRNTRYQQ